MAGKEDRVVGAFVELVDTLVDEYDVADMLHSLVGYCVSLLDASAAGILLADQRGDLHVLASSTERTRLLELFQLQTDEGPCLECFHTEAPVLVSDLGAEAHRWPSFAERALRDGFVSVHALPLRLRDRVVGAMNLFGVKPGTISGQDLRLARALADTAIIGILHERGIRRAETVVEQVQTVLNNRATIEQAKGVLSAHADLDMGRAFETLRDYARSSGAGLSQVARDVVDRVLDPGTVLSAQRTRGNS